MPGRRLDGGRYHGPVCVETVEGWVGVRRNGGGVGRHQQQQVLGTYGGYTIIHVDGSVCVT